MTTKSITDPNGVVWAVGDQVIRHGLYVDEPSRLTTIVSIFPGNESWDQEQPDGDHNAVWFTLADGYAARPWLLEKI